MLKKFWNDEGGGVVSPEICVVGGVLVIGVIVGLSAVQVALVGEVADVSAAIEAYDFTPNPVTEDDMNLSSPGSAPLTAADLVD